MFDRRLKSSMLRKLLSRNHWQSIEIIRDVTSPILFLTGYIAYSIFPNYILGTLDPVVPCHHSEKLYDAAVKAEFRQKVRFLVTSLIC